ncbi:MAG: hypothetical protein BWY02_00364 [bacterium ADurb.Bin157]|nr:MAG: hypothetical protein BWY02_00364 [bacterium ADurb.Bin157]
MSSVFACDASAVLLFVAETEVGEATETTEELADVGAIVG